VHAESGERVAHLFQLERLDDRHHDFHGLGPLLRRPPDHSGGGFQREPGLMDGCRGDLRKKHAKLCQP
jgi:hypothetical protein